MDFYSSKDLPIEALNFDHLIESAEVDSLQRVDQPELKPVARLRHSLKQIKLSSRTSAWISSHSTLDLNIVEPRINVQQTII